MKLSTLNLLELGLATWRLSYMLVEEPGPGNVFIKLRELTGIEHDESGEKLTWGLYTPLHCVNCTSLYVSILMLVMPNFIRRTLAASAIAVVLNKVDKYGQSDLR